MPIQIEIHESHIQPLVDFYVQRLRVLKDEIFEREKEVKEINFMIQKLRKKNTPDVPTANTSKVEYSENWPWARKITFAIELMKKPLTTKEIVDVLTEYESAFLFDRKRVVASISSTLSTKSGPGKEFNRIQNDSGEFAYHLTPEEGSPQHETEEVADLPF